MALVALLQAACRKNSPVDNTIKNVDSLDDMITDTTFNYRTSNDITFEIQLSAPDATPIVGVPITINQVVGDSLQLMFTLMTDQTGKLKDCLQSPAT